MQSCLPRPQPSNILTSKQQPTAVDIHVPTYIRTIFQDLSLLLNPRTMHSPFSLVLTITTYLTSFTTLFNAPSTITHDTKRITPKVIIISLFAPEAQTWHRRPSSPFNLLANNITLEGLSPLFPKIHCTSNGEICQLITGEA